MDPVVVYLRSHRWARRALSGASLALLLGAVALLAYPLYTNAYEGRLQRRLTHQLASPKLRRSYTQRTLQDGDALTRIKIPKLGVDVVVVEGTSSSALQAGAGHYPDTALPCEAGNVAIAGHRTTYGKPFANVDRLSPGDTIVLTTPLGSCTYEVSRAPFVTTPTDTSVVANDPKSRTLTLTSCHPKGSAAQRIVIKATYATGQQQAA